MTLITELHDLSTTGFDPGRLARIGEALNREIANGTLPGASNS